MENKARSGRNINPLEIVDEKISAEKNVQPNRISDDLAQEKKTSAISGSNGTRISNSAAASAGTSPYDVIFSFMASLDRTELKGIDALDEAVQNASSGKFSSAQEVIDQLISDCASTEGDSNTFLQDFCGIIIGNDDTGAITGYDTGYDGVKTAESVVPETGTRDTSFTDNEFTIKGFTFKLEKDFSELNDDEKFIWQSLYTYWAESSLNLIEESYGYSFEDDDVTVNTVTMKFITTVGGGTLADTGWWDNDGDGTVDEMDMIINTAYYGNFAEDDQDGVSSSRQAHLDRTFAHEITHAIMNAKIKYRYELPMFVSEGMAEITHGIDDVRTNDIRKLAADSSLLEQSLALDPNYHTMAGITAPDYSGGYIFLRYLAWQCSDIDALGLELTNTKANTVVSGSRFADTITNSGTGSTVYANDFDDTVTNSAANAAIYAGNGNDIIDNRGTGSYLDAGNGNDSISNTGTNVTINAGSGNDTINNAAHGNAFLYSTGDGNDLITGFNENDTLEIQSGSFIVSLNDNDALVSLTSGEIITLEGAAGLNLNITGKNLLDVTLSPDGESYRNAFENATIYGSGSGNDYIINTGANAAVLAGDGADTIYNYGAGSYVDAGNGNDYVYNSADGDEATLLGGSGDDTIHVNGSSEIAVDAGGGDNMIYVDSDASNVTVTAGGENDNVRINGSRNISISAGGGSNIVYADTGSANITVGAGEGDDSINNWAANSYISAGDGVNTISNSSSGGNTTITAGAGNDMVTNSASTVSIDAGAGDNFLYNSDAGSDVTMSAGSGNDTVQNSAANAIVEISAGDNRIFNRNTGTHSRFSLGSGSDTVQNWAAGAYVDAGAGDNNIANDESGASATLMTGAGNDSVSNGANEVIISAGSGNNTVISSGSDCAVFADEGNDYIYNGAGTGVTISAGAGDNTINNRGGGVAVFTNEGNDYIYNTGEGVTVNAGGGANTVNSSGANMIIRAGSGNDSLAATGANASIRAGDGDNTVYAYGGGSTISAGAGNDLIALNSSGGNVVRYSSGNDRIFGITASDTILVENENYELLDTDQGHAVVSVEGGMLVVMGGMNFDFSVATVAPETEDEIIPPSPPTPPEPPTPPTDTGVISLTSGNDFYSNETDKVTIHALAGSDTIDNSGNGVAIFGEEGNDEIFNEGNSATISGGKGNDTIWNDGSGNVFEYATGDGNDIIYDISTADTLTITGSFTYDTDGDDAIIKVGSGYITLDSAAQIEVNINGKTYKAEEETIPSDVISLTSGNDSYSNDTDKVTIHALAGNDTIDNSGNEVVIFGEAGNDEIFNYGNSATISGGKGNDTIYNDGSGNVFEYATGDGNDIIYDISTSDKITITGDFTYSTDGDDAIIKVGSGSITLDNAAQIEVNINGKTYKASDTIPPDVISLTSGNDSYSNDTDNVTIHALAGNDTIDNSGNGVVIFGEAGADIIYSKGNSATISGGKGNDTIYSEGTGALFEYSTGDGSDRIYGITSADTITVTSGNFTYSTSGDDAIIKVGTGAITLDSAAQIEVNINGETYKAEEETIPTDVISLTSGNDSYSNETDKVTIHALAGNDTIDNSGNEVVIFGEAGNDEIFNYGNSATISGGKGNDTIYNDGSGNVFEYTTGDGNDIIYDITANDTITIAGDFTYSTDGDDAIIKIGSGSITLDSAAQIEVNINGETYKTEEETVPPDVISLTSGNDSYSNETDKVTIHAMAGNDTIDNSGNEVVIFGEEGNDEIFNDGNSATISGGKGNDTIYNDGTGALFEYATGDGNDIIYDISTADTLTIAGSFTYSTDGDDAIIKIGSGSITLDSAAQIEVNINGKTYKAEEDTDTLPAGITISGKTMTVGKDFTGDSVAADEFDSAVTNVDASKLSRGISIVGNAAANSLKGGSGADTITGGAGNDTLTGGSGSDIFMFSAGNDFITDYAAGTDKISISGAITSESLSGSNVVLKIGTGSLTIKNGKSKQITVIDKAGAETTREYAAASTDTDTESTGLTYNTSTKTLTINAAYEAAALDAATLGAESAAKTIDASALTKAIKITGTKNATAIIGGAGADTLIGGAGNDTLTGNAGADVFVYTGGNDAIKDYSAAQKDIISVAGGTISGASLSGSNEIFKIGSGAVTVTGGKNQEISIGSAIYYNNVVYDTKKTAMTIGAAQTGTLKATDYATTVKVINATAPSKAVYIIGNAAANSISGSKNNDTLTGGKGNDTLTGNAGADVFIYEAGNDIITDYTASQKDTIKLSSGSVTGATLKSNDLSIKTSSGGFTVKGGKGQEVTIGSAVYYNNVVYDTKKTAMTIGSAQSGTLKATDYATSVKKIDASTLSKAAVVGNAQANSILGSKGKDTLTGGKGNDTLTGGAGADVFIYEAGNDVITDYTAKDKDTIKLASGSVTGATLKGNDLALKIGSGAVTVKGAKNQEVTIGSAVYYNNVVYDTKKTAMTVGSGQTSTLKATDYATSVKKIDASTLSKAAVVGNAQANSILGGKGKDTLSGGKGNDTLTGGAGADVFIYEAGNDVITDYTAKDKDTINIGSAKVTGATLKGSDLALKIGSGAMTIKGAKNQEVTIGSTIYYNSVSYDSKKTAVTIGSAFTDTLKAADIGSKVATIDGSAAAKAINVIGNDAANLIIGGKGNDTLDGGKGNDTLTGGDGKDVFIFSAGKDVITDYAAGKDTIQINGTISTTSVSGSDVVFTIDSKNTLTVKNGKGAKITIKDSSGKTTTETYNGNGNAAVPWFAEDDTLFAGGARLDDISAENYSVTNIEPDSSFDTLAQADFSTLTTSN